ncbi:hypothetical protein [Chitinimonas sp.]|uniref:hypothetical protein n=1 Tax=Chitinimonas sp. TaxID=1934313 RepID=UPI002F92E26B
MNRIAKLIAATAAGLAFAQAAAAAPVFAFSEDAYNSQFTPEAQAAAKAAEPAGPLHIDSKAQFSFSEDVFNSPVDQAAKPVGNQSDQIVIKARSAQQAAIGSKLNLAQLNQANELYQGTNL